MGLLLHFLKNSCMEKTKNDIAQAAPNAPEEAEDVVIANEPLREENAILKDANAGLQQENDKLKEAIAEQDLIIKQKDAAIARITEQMKVFVQGSISISSNDAPKAKPSIPVPFVEIDGVEYEFQKPAFSLEGRTYSAQEAAADAEVLKKLIAIDGQTILKELV